MSGEPPPHHPHNRPWDFIGIPNWRQPQHAHMGHKHSIIHQSNWHPPTTESMKVLGHIPHNYALHQMFENVAVPTPPVGIPVLPPCVDLSLPSSQNGESASTPISLSVKDSKKTPATDPAPKCPPSKTKTSDSEHLVNQPSSDSKSVKKATPLDSVLERLKPSYVNSTDKSGGSPKRPDVLCDVSAISSQKGVIVPPNPSQDESSDSSTLVVQNSKEEETVSPYNTEDSLDSTKSRRKRKPTKTLRCSKNEERVPEENTDNPIEVFPVLEEKPVVEDKKETPNPTTVERRRSSSLDLNIPAKTRRKTSSESETIDNIAAMVQEGLKEKEQNKCNDITFVPVSVIKTKDELEENMCQESTVSESTTRTSNLVTPAQKKETHFVEIENKLEEMFAGIEDTVDPLITQEISLEESKLEDPLQEDPAVASTSQDNVSSTSNDISSSKSPAKSRKRPAKPTKSTQADTKSSKKNKNVKNAAKNKKKAGLKAAPAKNEVVKEVSYDSGSNASSSKSKGPFIHIKGPSNSPISVNVVNTPSIEDDAERRIKSKKFHDDSEYRHKVRSKGLHCSTLSNKYDAQTKDTTWICVFCKKGPHTNDSFPSGDLFGPYFITSNCEEFERKLEDPYDKQFRSKKMIRALEAPKVVKKTKRKHSEGEGDGADPFLGIIETSNGSYEVWVHEDCVVWSPGVYLVGPKIIGLQEAVWTACNVVCTQCNCKGANICCLYRGCVKVTHVWCAKALGWCFDEENFKTFCEEHSGC